MQEFSRRPRRRTLSRMRTSIQALLTTIAVLVVPATASADFGHVVAPGETLTSVAAADGLSVAQVAAANGLSPYTQIVAGSTMMIPPQTRRPGGGREPVAHRGGHVERVRAAARYVVQPGDTLSAIAARAGLTVASLAADNGLDPNGCWCPGRRCRSAAGRQAGGIAGPPASSAGRTSSSRATRCRAIAARAGTTVGRWRPPTAWTRTASCCRGSGAHSRARARHRRRVGRSPAAADRRFAEGTASDPPTRRRRRSAPRRSARSPARTACRRRLAEAIGWQESGFNNDLVSSTTRAA